jgi:Kef-type K+ transport system membrane component KefB
LGLYFFFNNWDQNFIYCYIDGVSYLLQCIGSPVLGYLAAGILIGPYGLSIIRYVHGTKAIAEFGVVFLLFNIGLEVEITFINLAALPLHFMGPHEKN